MSRFSHKEGKKFVPRPGAWDDAGYHIAKKFLPDYEEALVAYLKGTLIYKYLEQYFKKYIFIYLEQKFIK